MMKDRAYMASGPLIEHNLGKKGVEKERYMSQYFKKVWDQHDKESKNMIDAGDAKSFFQDLLQASASTDEE